MRLASHPDCGGLAGGCATCAREFTEWQIRRDDAEEQFLLASVAVWREIDRIEAEPGGYHPVRMSVELRQSERAAWERYRNLLDAPPQ